MNARAGQAAAAPAGEVAAAGVKPAAQVDAPTLERIGATAPEYRPEVTFGTKPADNVEAVVRQATERAPAAAPTEVARLVKEMGALQATLDLSEALRVKLQAENDALMAKASPLFNPKSTAEACRQFEREAFAQGLHHAAISKRKKD